MVSLKSLQCPRCGATVALNEREGRGTCTYCGTVSYAGKRGESASAVAPKGRVGIWVGLGVLVAVIVLAAVFAAQEARESGPGAVSAIPAVPTRDAPVVQPAVVAPPPTPVPVVRAASFALARLIGGEGDSPRQVLVPVQQELSGKTTLHFAIYDFTRGLLKQTVALEDPEQDLSVVVGKRLVLASPVGQVRGFDLASLDAQWSTALGERVAALCEAAGGAVDTVHVVTDDERNLLLDLTTGRQSETKTPCKAPLAVSHGRHAPSDRRDYRAPRDVLAWLCGGVRVMGSQSYAVPDACRARAKLDSEGLPGMVGHAAWRFGNGWLVFGVRTPGTYVPVAGLYEKKRWTWKTEVPSENPLEAEQGGPRHVSLHGDSLVVGYTSGRPSRRWITRFDARDGTRSWSTTLPDSAQTLIALEQSDDAVVVHSNDAVRVLSVQEGKVSATLGGP